jgi:hypothetical protein
MQLDYYLTLFYLDDGCKVFHSSKKGRIVAWYIEAQPFIRCAEVLVSYRGEKRELVGTNCALCATLKDVREALKQFADEEYLKYLEDPNSVELQSLTSER